MDDLFLRTYSIRWRKVRCLVLLTQLEKAGRLRRLSRHRNNHITVYLVMEASHVLRIFQPNTSTEDLVELNVKEGFLELPEYVITSHLWGWILFTFLVICVSLNLAGKGYIIWFVKHVAQERPLNALITFDQVSP